METAATPAARQQRSRRGVGGERRGRVAVERERERSCSPPNAPRTRTVSFWLPASHSGERGREGKGERE